ncbi:hypothetical protein KC19_6G126500 [Ceratodon purpureus]|uniref:LNS2/PITP domain-containing protein n=1 Tax=Ceratodon purpureus TaxID=3225 RepID=A0A8T0HG42_CERPU|nr:hypothetical protein KC19_6G126500 [Ceratodon purpureus]
MTSSRERIGDRLRRGLKSGRRVIQRLPSHLHLPRCSFNGAEDIIYVRRDGSIRCTGWYLSISRLSSIRYGERDSDIKIKINGQVVSYYNGREYMDFSINLNEISRGAGKNVVGVPVYAPADWENELIFRYLGPGRNKITFYIEGQPNSSVDARIYRWEWNSNVVVVDMDGTITRSELRGILHCYTEEHYLHPEVSTFFLYLKALGYKVIYLTARPITTIKSTRKYLVDDFDQFQREEFTKLPDGPVFTSCDGRIRTTLNYVGVATGLGGASHFDFKASFLTEIRKLFYDGALRAGFGNTEADKRSYRSVGIPEERIFDVKKGGRIFTRHPHRFRSYGDLLVKCRSEGIFPCVGFDHNPDDFFGHIDARMIKWLNWIMNHMPPQGIVY